MLSSSRFDDLHSTASGTLDSGAQVAVLNNRLSDIVMSRRNGQSTHFSESQDRVTQQQFTEPVSVGGSNAAMHARLSDTRQTSSNALNGRLRPLDNAGDGVWVGFLPAVSSYDPVTHVFIWTIVNGVGHAIELGPVNDGGPLQGKNFDNAFYKDDPSKATYGFVKVTPSGTLSQTRFAEAVQTADQDYGSEAYTSPSQIPTYSIANNNNCEGFASGLLTAVGVSADQLTSIKGQSAGIDPYFTSPVNMNYQILEGAKLNSNSGNGSGSSRLGGGGNELAGFSPYPGGTGVHISFNGITYY